MEDFKLIMYVLAIVAYFIYTAWRKAFKTPDERPDAPQVERERPQREQPAQRPIPPAQPQQRQQRPQAPATSFEDILREMQTKMERANEQATKPVEKPKPALKKPMMQAAMEEREAKRALTLENPEQARIYNQQRKERLAAADAINEANKQKRNQVPNIYGQLLHNPQSVRQAFILSEIFNRKQY